MSGSKQKAFTLIELLIVIAIIGLLSSIVLVALNNARGKGRDAKRIADIRQLVTALNLYYSDNNVYPPVVDPSGPGGWETTLNSYLTGLVSGGYISVEPNDPLNRIVANIDLFVRQGNYYYAYYNYPASSAVTYNCPFTTPFAVIAIKEVEGVVRPDYPKATCGVPPMGGCPLGGLPGVCRDWSTEFEYSIIMAQ